MLGFQYSYANPKWLEVSVLSYDFNDDTVLNLVEYEPKISKKLGFFTRFQTLYVRGA